MKKNSLFILLVVLALTAAPFAFGATLGEGLVGDGTETCAGGAPNCTFTDFVKLINKIITFVIKLSIPIAAIGFGIAGFYYITDQGSETRRKKGNEIFYWTFIGFVVILSAWLVVKTILSGLGVNDSAFNLLKR